MLMITSMLPGTSYGADRTESLLTGGEQAFEAQAAAVQVSEAHSGGVADTSWYTSDAASFLLSDADELAGLAVLVNAGNDFEGKTILLDGDMDLSGYENWTPIGGRETPFAGVFDGCGHTLSGLTIENGQDEMALFGRSTGELRDFTVTGSVSGGSYSAGVAALAGGTVAGVTSSVEVSASGSQAGGIAADGEDGLLIEDCRNTGSVVNNTSEKSSGKLAGILGRFESGSAVIRNCSNEGDINSYQYVAGIIGGCFGNVSVEACCNSGSITARSFGKVYLGGIVGKLQDGTVDSCYNTGTLTDEHIADGHIRAVGGIVGCEADRDPAEGTAVSCCYNTGMILLNAENMSDSKYIYMAGNISGGNQATDANTMHYRNCYYLENTFPLQDPSHPYYAKWSDVFKDNPLAYDTEDVICCTAAELAKADLGKKFVSGSPYPILYWQAGGEEPEKEARAISLSVTGGSAETDLPEEAREGDEVSFTVSNVTEGMQIGSVTVTDEAGSELTVGTAEESDGTTRYSFIMPDRAVSVSIVLENAADPDAERFSLRLPEGLDAIWSVRAESSYYDAETGTVPAGATVTIIVEKQDKAVTTSFDGVEVTAADGTAAETEESGARWVSGAKCYGEYRFTMPESDAEAALEETYSDLTVTDDGGISVSYTRQQMMALGSAGARTYFSGWSTERDPFVGASDCYVALNGLLQASGIAFGQGDTLKVTAADGFAQSYTYEELYGAERFCFRDILENGSDAADRTPFEPVLTVTANMTTDGDPEELVCDTLSTYRFVIGQTESELQNHVKIVDRLPKCVTEIRVEHGEETAGAPAFVSHSLLLSGEIGVNFYMDLPGDVHDYAGSYVEFTVNGRTSTAAFDEDKKNAAGTCYGFTCYVNAISMADEITAVFRYDGGSVKDIYSAAKYVNDFEAERDSFTSETAALIEALADYGHYTQLFMAEKNGWSIGTDHARMLEKPFTEYYDTDAVRESASAYAQAMDISSPDLEAITCSLLLDADTSLYVYLKPAAGYEGAVQILLDDSTVYGAAGDSAAEESGAAVENGKMADAVECMPDGRYRVAVTDMAAHELGDMHEIAVVTDHGTANLRISAISYVYSLLGSEAYADNRNALNAMSALYFYHATAATYINKT